MRRDTFLQRLEDQESEIHREGVERLVVIRNALDDEAAAEVRLHVWPDEDADGVAWEILDDDPAGDEDHVGYWAAAGFDQDATDDDLGDLLGDLLSEVAESADL